MGQISGDWQAALKEEFRQPYYARLYKTVMNEYKSRKNPGDGVLFVSSGSTSETFVLAFEYTSVL